MVCGHGLPTYQTVHMDKHGTNSNTIVVNTRTPHTINKIVCPLIGKEFFSRKTLIKLVDRFVILRTKGQRATEHKQR